MCACKHKGPRSPGVVNVSDMTSPMPERPASTFVPPAPPPRARMQRLPMPPMTMERPGVPQDGGMAVFVPPPPPPRITSTDVPVRRPTPTVLKRPEDAPLADMPVVLTIAPMPTALQPLPGRPYCADARLAGTELCAGAQVTEMCAGILAAWLVANPQAPLSAFLGSSSAMGELCADEFHRVLSPAGGKTSGALPNYHRASGVVNPDSAEGRALAMGQQGYGILTDPGMGANVPYGGASSWQLDGAAWQAPPAPSSPPVDYGALIGGIGTAVGASLTGIGTIVNNAQQNRLRELEIEYRNNAQGAQLALQRATMETQAEIARLSQSANPQAQAVVGVLQQQVADMNARLAQANAPMSDTTKILLGLGALVVVGGGVYLATRK